MSYVTTHSTHVRRVYISRQTLDKSYVRGYLLEKFALVLLEVLGLDLAVQQVLGLGPQLEHRGPLQRLACNSGEWTC